MKAIEVRLHSNDKILEIISEEDAIKQYGALFKDKTNLLEKIIKLLKLKASYHTYKIIDL